MPDVRLGQSGRVDYRKLGSKDPLAPSTVDPQRPDLPPQIRCN